MEAEHRHFVALSDGARSQVGVYNARTGEVTAVAVAPPGVSRFNGVAAAGEEGLYFLSGVVHQPGTTAGTGLLRLRLSRRGQVAELALLYMDSSQEAMSGIIGPLISVTPDGSQIVCPAGRLSFPPREPLKIAIYDVVTGRLTQRGTRWPGVVWDLSWSGNGETLAFLWGSGRDEPPQTGPFTWDPANGETQGIRVVSSAAADWVANSRHVVDQDSPLGMLQKPLISVDGTTVFAAVKEELSLERAESAAVLKLIQMDIDGGVPLRAWKFPHPPDASYGYLSVCRDVAGQSLLVFSARHIVRLDLSTGQWTDIPYSSAHPIIYAAW
jgi:hypothetical protein